MYSSVGGHFGCFPVLAIVNSASLNIRVNISFQISGFFFFFLVYIDPGVELLDHMVGL